MVGLVLLGYLGLVGSVCGMLQVEACGHSADFGYRGETCELWSVLATGMRPVSLWPLVTVGNLSGVVMVRRCLGLGAILCI
jgi:hypothetical protein